MKIKTLLLNLLIIHIFFIALTSAQLGYNNPKLPRINTPTGVASINTTNYNNITNIYTNVTGEISNASLNLLYINLSGTNANQNINVGIYNITASLFKGLFNWSASSEFNWNGAFLSLATSVSQWFYNQTTPVFTTTLLNQTIEDRGRNVGFNKTFNETYHNLINQNCPSGQVFNGTLSNGTFICQNVATTFDNINISYLNNTQTFLLNQTFGQNISITDSLFVNVTKEIYAGGIILLNDTTDSNNYANCIEFFDTADRDYVGVHSYWALCHNRVTGQMDLRKAWNGAYSLPFVFYRDGSINMTGNLNTTNITAYIINASYLKGDGSMITNVTSTVVPNSTLVPCQNITGNSLCQTGQPIFAGINTTASSRLDVPGALGTWARFTVLNGAIELANLNSLSGFFFFQAASNQPLGFGNDDLTGQMNINDDGSVLFRVRNGINVEDALKRYFITNNTRTTLNSSETRITSSIINFTGNTTFAPSSTYHNWAVNNGIINATGVNITGQHQTYNMTAQTALDTTYTNNLERTLCLSITTQSVYIGSGDSAYITIYSEGSNKSASSGMFEWGAGDLSDFVYENYNTKLCVQPTKSWSINSTTDFNGAVTLISVIGDVDI